MNKLQVTFEDGSVVTYFSPKDISLKGLLQYAKEETGKEIKSWKLI